ncbi:hypothetical protein VPH35_065720 [Triticum aestivum]
MHLHQLLPLTPSPTTTEQGTTPSTTTYGTQTITAPNAKYRMIRGAPGRHVPEPLRSVSSLSSTHGRQVPRCRCPSSSATGKHQVPLRAKTPRPFRDSPRTATNDSNSYENLYHYRRPWSMREPLPMTSERIRREPLPMTSERIRRPLSKTRTPTASRT